MTADDGRLAELVAVLSVATDVATGRPPEHGIRCCLVAMRLGECVGLGRQEAAGLFYLALLRMLGCTATSVEAARLLGDELSVGRRTELVDFGRNAETVRWLVRHLGEDEPPRRRVRLLARSFATGPRQQAAMAEAHCEVAQILAARLPIGDVVRDHLPYVYERWDGAGPRRSAGESIPLLMRIVHLARDLEVFHRHGGAEAALRMAAQRSGMTFDPALVARLLRRPRHVLDVLTVPSPWTALLAVEPAPQRTGTAADVDAVASVMADMSDLKSRFTPGHSRGVAALAARAAGHCSATDAEIRTIRWAGLAHDLGRVTVSASVWDRPGPLTDQDWEQVRLHPYLTERILRRSAALSPAAHLAGLHHERSDGSGYYRGARGGSLPVLAQVLAAADAYQAMTEARPHRPARTPDEAGAALVGAAKGGKFDPGAVAAVLAAAGRPRGSLAGTGRPAGLTDREVEVLRLAAAGLTIKEMARRLHVAPKTVDNHLQHVYAKVGVSSRAAATVFAMQHGLVPAAVDEENSP